MTTKRQVRCALYTRKSTEEGLEQDFNSLDAQREACESYILSQKAEGWIALKDRFDDGGYSGGTLERPALRQLLKAIEDGLVDVVVVYKIDRLSRSLMDFAKLVEVFDRKGVTFVSVTQSFNTTNSMGRLTLNVLLSFAQFEREVTGERIRDKFAASKKKGIWMGGNPPLGYDVQNRKLVVNEKEAADVRLIFERYLELGSAYHLADDLSSKRIYSKARTLSEGRRIGGKPMQQSALYKLLANRTYLGKTHHKGHWYAGEHAAIVSKTVFDAVQARLADQGPGPLKARSSQDAPFAGLVFDETGTNMCATYVLKRGVRYRYYVSRPVLRGSKSKASIHRLPAPPFEVYMTDVFVRLELIAKGADTASPSNLGEARGAILRIDVLANSIVVRLAREALLSACRAIQNDELQDMSDGELIDRLRRQAMSGETLSEDRDAVVLALPVRARFHGGRSSIHYPNAPAIDVAQPDQALIKAVARAWRWRQMLNNGEVTSVDELARHLRVDRGYTGQVLRLAFLSPELIRAIVDGRQPPGLKLAQLLRTEIPSDWSNQKLVIDQLVATT